MAQVRIPAPLRALTKNARIVQAVGVTLAEIVDDLERQFPGIRARLLDGDGAVHAFINIFVNDEDIRFQQGLATPVPERSDVSIVPAMAGGA
jgi:molybdopterin converting factor small subunit